LDGLSTHTFNVIESTREIPLDSIEPNPWNPNEMTAEEVEAQRQSILRFGFIDPGHARPHPEKAGRFQVLDGEHRRDIMLGFVRDGLPENAHPSLYDLVAREVIPTTVLENLGDADAKKLTLILNGGGKNNTVKLGALLSQIRDEQGEEAAMIALPFTKPEWKEFTGLGEFDWNAVKQEASASTQGETLSGNAATEPAKNRQSGNDSDFVRFTVAMPRDAYEHVFQQAYDLIKETLESDGQLLHAKKEIAHGQVLEALSAEYLAMPGYANSSEKRFAEESEEFSADDFHGPKG
jgi:hypothetical protein